jgi:hypothetical protein
MECILSGWRPFVNSGEKAGKAAYDDNTIGGRRSLRFMPCDFMTASYFFEDSPQGESPIPKEDV